MKLLKILIPFALIAGIGSIALTGCGRHHHDPQDKADYIVHKISKKMDLNDAQKAKLDEVKQEFLKYHKKHKGEKADMIDRLLTEIEKPEMDPSVLQAMVDEHKAKIDEMAPGIIAKLVEFHATLDNEQKHKLVEKLEKFKKHHES